MGGRLATPPSSASSSSATAHRNPISSSTTNLAHPRAYSTGNSHVFPTHRHRSSSGHHHHHHHHHNRHHQGAHALIGNHQSRQRTGSTNIEPIAPTAFNLNLLRYVGLNHESDDQSSDEDSPRTTHRRIPPFLIAIRDVPCPVCNKTIPNDIFDKHLLQCLSKPRVSYNEDTLTEDKGECVICLDDLLAGQKIARLPCLCIYHKSCIDNWFQINRTCPEHPGD